jgi:molecular chaperone GrpE
MAEVESGQSDPENEGAIQGGAPDDAGESPEIVELRKRCDEFEQTVSQLRDQLLRKAAEFDNYKKRTEAEALSVIRYANEDLLLKILPVVDDLERSFKALGGKTAPPAPAASAPDAPADGETARREAAFIAGVELIFGKLRKTLEQVGLTPFESVGKPFDPELHDALLQVPREDLPHHTVVEEIDRGYQLNDRVVRHARVIVSSQPGPGGK